MKGLVKKIADPGDISGLNELPQHFKDLALIIQNDCEFSLGENNIDHQSFIDKYKDIIGVEIKDSNITENKDKDIAIKFICYRQAIHCYEHLMKNKPHTKLSEDQQNEYELLIKQENKIALNLHSIDDLDSLSEELKLTREIMIPYFTSYSKNKFINPSKEYYPR